LRRLGAREDVYEISPVRDSLAILPEEVLRVEAAESQKR
jgi:hypothetical protein